MERDSAEGCGIRKKYAVASVVHMREQRERRGEAVLPVKGDWGRRVGIAGLPLDFYEKLCYNEMGIKKQGARTK